MSSSNLTENWPTRISKFCSAPTAAVIFYTCSFVTVQQLQSKIGFVTIGSRKAYFHFTWAAQITNKSISFENSNKNPKEQIFLAVHETKGQIISKRLLVSSDSSKKRTNEFGFLPNSIKNEFVRSFFGRIRGYQKVLSKLSVL